MDTIALPFNYGSFDLKLHFMMTGLKLADFVVNQYQLLIKKPWITESITIKQ
ncbi:hypothetical protein [Lactiplantibacillus plantarum]|uniref:hypothetical protein n=1 Tax=Lactiplantibacillus plantarum TaxID=1590 RepID=UPI00165110E0|nr:hypothetical protein [Lactiplantibacillus plantarum]